MTSRPRSTVIRRFPGALGVAVAALAAIGAGCGSSGGGTSTDPADDFAGTWRYDKVQSVLQCQNADPTNQPPEPNKTLARGVSATLVDLSPSPLLPGVFCDFGFDVSNGIATAQPNQTCPLTMLDSLTIDVGTDNSPLWTITLNSPTTASEIVQATAHFQIAGQPSTCSWNLVANLIRISKD
jgi:hypothetical protein